MKNNITFPDEFTARMKSILPADEHEAFFDMMSTPLRKAIRVNTLKISVDEFQKIADEQEWRLTPIPWCDAGFWIDRESHEVPLGRTWLHAAGLFYIQEAASMLPPEILSPTAGQTVLDVAAAPGSKTTQLAAMMDNSGCLIANEPMIKRIKSLSHNVEITGSGIVQLAKKDGRAFAKYFPNTFDKILLDAPCTGEGTLRKDPRALRAWKLSKIQAMADLQFELAVAAVHALRPAGELVYSTCTLAPEENEEVVSRLLDHFGDDIELIPVADANGITEFDGRSYDPRVAGSRRLWPQRADCEGFFAAKLRKVHATKQPAQEAGKRAAGSPFRRVRDKLAAEYLSSMGSWFGYDVALPAGTAFFIRGDELWLRPSNIESFATKLSFERTGNRVAKLNREGKLIRSTHMGGALLIADPTQHVLELTDAQRDEFLGGRDFKIPPNPPLEKGGSEQSEQGDSDGQCIVRYRGYYLGLGLLRDGKLKNQLPRDFILGR